MSDLGRIVYSCPFVPAEWIDAHGFQASRASPPPSAAGDPIGDLAGMCPYARAFGNLAVGASDAVAIVLTTVCDQMRRCADAIHMACDLPCFLLHVPHTWEHPAAVKLYRSELIRLGKFLEAIGGTTPSKSRLVNSIQSHDRGRKRLRDSAGVLGARQWAEAAADYHESGSLAAPKAIASRLRGPGLALVGGPIPRARFGLYDLIEDSGGRLALNGSETGERTLAAPIKTALLQEDPLTAITEAYFGSIPDPFRRPNSALFAWLNAEIRRREVAGVIVHRYLWCDVWHAEVQRISDWVKVPVLDLDAADERGDVARIQTRIGAFVEGLR